VTVNPDTSTLVNSTDISLGSNNTSVDVPGGVSTGSLGQGAAAGGTPSTAGAAGAMGSAAGAATGAVGSATSNTGAGSAARSGG
jgi:hypothetical protein